jgi:hypothetical protein
MKLLLRDLFDLMNDFQEWTLPPYGKKRQQKGKEETKQRLEKHLKERREEERQRREVMMRKFEEWKASQHHDSRTTLALEAQPSRATASPHKICEGGLQRYGLVNWSPPEGIR